MTGKKIQTGGVTYHGFLPDTDPIYQGGWNFLNGKNLKSGTVNPKTIEKAATHNTKPPKE